MCRLINLCIILSSFFSEDDNGRCGYQLVCECGQQFFLFVTPVIVNTAMGRKGQSNQKHFPANHGVA